MTGIIFLDIDGVLNSSFWNKSHEREISDGTLIDHDKVKLLACLVKKTDAKLILHSGWRIWFDEKMCANGSEAERLVQILASEGLYLDGMTPDLTTEEIRRTRKFSLVKADEILLWLKNHPEVQNWIVLDDLDLHQELITEHQVKTDQNVGLTLEDIQRAEEMLKK